MTKTRNKFISLLLAVCMVVTLIPIPAAAGEIEPEVEPPALEQTQGAEEALENQELEGVPEQPFNLEDQIKTLEETEKEKVTKTLNFSKNPASDDSQYESQGWKWDNETKTLTLNGLDISAETCGIHLPAGAIIELRGNAKVHSYRKSDTDKQTSAIISDGELTIKGPGKLQIDSIKGIVTGGDTVVEDGCILEIDKGNAITTGIINSDVTDLHDLTIGGTLLFHEDRYGGIYAKNFTLTSTGFIKADSADIYAGGEESSLTVESGGRLETKGNISSDGILTIGGTVRLGGNLDSKGALRITDTGIVTAHKIYCEKVFTVDEGGQVEITGSQGVYASDSVLIKGILQAESSGITFLVSEPANLTIADTATVTIGEINGWYAEIIVHGTLNMLSSKSMYCASLRVSGTGQAVINVREVYCSGDVILERGGILEVTVGDSGITAQNFYFNDGASITASSEGNMYAEEDININFGTSTLSGSSVLAANLIIGNGSTLVSDNYLIRVDNLTVDSGASFKHSGLVIIAESAENNGTWQGNKTVYYGEVPGVTPRVSKDLILRKAIQSTLDFTEVSEGMNPAQTIDNLATEGWKWVPILAEGVVTGGTLTLDNILISANYGLVLPAGTKIELRDQSVNHFLPIEVGGSNAIYGLGSLTIAGKGEIKIQGKNGQGILVEDGNLVVSGGTLHIQQRGEHAEAIYVRKGNLTLSGGVLNLTNTEWYSDGSFGILAAVNPYGSCGIYLEQGDMAISGGTLHIQGYNSGLVNAGPTGNINISGGTQNIILGNGKRINVGISSLANVKISGGTIAVEPGSDDEDHTAILVGGLPYMTEDGSLQPGNLQVSGGTVTLNSGIQVVGKINFSGGRISAQGDDEFPAILSYALVSENMEPMITISGMNTTPANAKVVSIDLEEGTGEGTINLRLTTFAAEKKEFTDPYEFLASLLSEITLTKNTRSSDSTPPQGTTVTGSLLDNKTGQELKPIKAEVFKEKDGTLTVAMKAQENLQFRQPNGKTAPISAPERLGFSAGSSGSTDGNTQIKLKADGTIEIANLKNETNSTFRLTYDLGNGQQISIGTLKVKVNSKGKVDLSCSLIDPYGIITDPATGQAIAGAEITLYYADTARNREKGLAPGTLVELPVLPDFAPNDNRNPQTSDPNGFYAFMVFPNADYYLTAVKEGYENYRSIVISVEEEIVEWNFKLNKPLAGIHRLAGESRVDTALAIAKANYTEKVANAVLATAANYPDALTGSVLAYKLQAPILLVGSNKADQDKVLNYLRENLQADGKVYILGGTGAIPLEVEKAVQRIGFTNITRLSGDNRGKTALAIAERLEVQKGRPVILVNENSYADALVVSSIAAVAQSPILPVGKDRLSAEMKTKLAELNPDRVYLIGGEGVLSPAIVKEIEEITSLNSSRIIRIAGQNRYETALAIAQYFNPQGQNVCLATGKNFPDALAGLDTVQARQHHV